MPLDLINISTDKVRDFVNKTNTLITNTITGGTYNQSASTLTLSSSASTINITGFTTSSSDTFVTGGTFVAETLTLTRSNGDSFDVTGFTSSSGTDTFITGGTYSNSGQTLTLINSSGDIITVNNIYNKSFDETLYIKSGVNSPNPQQGLKTNPFTSHTQSLGGYSSDYNILNIEFLAPYTGITISDEFNDRTESISVGLDFLRYYKYNYNITNLGISNILATAKVLIFSENKSTLYIDGQTSELNSFIQLTQSNTSLTIDNLIIKIRGINNIGTTQGDLTFKNCNIDTTTPIFKFSNNSNSIKLFENCNINTNNSFLINNQDNVENDTYYFKKCTFQGNNLISRVFDKNINENVIFEDCYFNLSGGSITGLNGLYVMRGLNVSNIDLNPDATIVGDGMFIKQSNNKILKLYGELSNLLKNRFITSELTTTGLTEVINSGITRNFLPDLTKKINILITRESLIDSGMELSIGNNSPNYDNILSSTTIPYTNGTGYESNKIINLNYTTDEFLDLSSQPIFVNIITIDLATFKVIINCDIF